jgi:hypothetical protein
MHCSVKIIKPLIALLIVLNTNSAFASSYFLPYEVGLITSSVESVDYAGYQEVDVYGIDIDRVTTNRMLISTRNRPIPKFSLALPISGGDNGNDKFIIRSDSSAPFVDGLEVILLPLGNAGLGLYSIDESTLSEGSSNQPVLTPETAGWFLSAIFMLFATVYGIKRIRSVFEF